METCLKESIQVSKSIHTSHCHGHLPDLGHVRYAKWLTNLRWSCVYSSELILFQISTQWWRIVFNREYTLFFSLQAIFICVSSSCPLIFLFGIVILHNGWDEQSPRRSVSTSWQSLTLIPCVRIVVDYELYLWALLRYDRWSLTCTNHLSKRYSRILEILVVYMSNVSMNLFSKPNLLSTAGDSYLLPWHERGWFAYGSNIEHDSIVLSSRFDYHWACSCYVFRGYT